MSATGSVISGTLGTIADGLYDVRVDFKDVTGPAWVTLAYASTGLSPRAIPTSRLYSSPSALYGSPFSVVVMPNLVCATTSSMAGPGLSSLIAGTPAPFTITARDVFSNLLTASTNAFVVRLAPSDGTLRAVGCDVNLHVVPGRYVASCAPTAATTFNLTAAIVGGSGVFGTYYDTFSATLGSSSPALTRADATIDFSHGASAPIVGSDNSYAVVWRGFAKPPTSVGTYSVDVAHAGTSDRGARLWIDGRLLIDCWSVTASCASATIGFSLNAATYYDLKMDFWFGSAGTMRAKLLQNGATMAATSLAQAYQVGGALMFPAVGPSVTDFDASSISGGALTLATAGVAAQFTITAFDVFNNRRTRGGDIFTARITGSAGSSDVQLSDLGSGLYAGTYVVSGQGAYSLSVALGSALKSTSVLVQPAQMCASVSLGNGGGLSVATAGFVQMFSVISRDEYRNVRTIDFNELSVRLVSADGAETHTVPSDYIGAAPDINLGKYVSYYRPTRSGSFSLSVRHASVNGLNATVFNDANLTYPVGSLITDGIDYNWGRGPPPLSPLADRFSIRWTGLVKAPHSGTFTFTVIFAETDERVRLWVRDRWLVDVWTATANAATSLSGTVDLLANALYDVRVDYAELFGFAQVSLLWSSAAIPLALVPSQRLFASTFHISGSPFSVAVAPSITCGTTSIAFGSGLTVSTAGVASSFTIQAKDALGNNVTTASDAFVVRVGTLDTVGTSTTAFISATVSSVSSGQYRVRYVPRDKKTMHSGFQPLLVSFVPPSPYIFATYYTSFAGAPQTAPVALTGAGLSVTPTSATRPVVRYSGLIRPTAADLYTFSFSGGASHASNRLIIQGVTVINAGVSGTYQFLDANIWYDLYVQYETAASPTVVLQFATAGAALASLPTSAFGAAADLTFRTFESNGLTATYYTSVGSAPRSGVRYVDTVDFSGTSQNDRPDTSINTTPAQFVATWGGFIRPSRSDLYTFYLVVSSSLVSTETASLVIDGTSVITYTAPGTGTLVSGTAKFPVADDLYDIALTYSYVGSSASHRYRITLMWANSGLEGIQFGAAAPPASALVSFRVVPSSRLFRARTTLSALNRDDSTFWFTTQFAPGGCDSSPSKRECRGLGIRVNSPPRTEVKATQVNAAQSQLNDATVFNAVTAGAAITFTLTARDDFGNRRDSTTDGFAVRAFLPTEWSSDPFYGTYVHTPSGSSLDNVNGTYVTSLLITRSGTFSLSVQSGDAGGKGLLGTYFATTTLSGASSTRVDPSVSFRWASAGPFPLSPIFSRSAFSVRWVGFLLPADTQTHTFFVSSDCGANLFVARRQLVGALGTAAASSEISSTISLASGILYDIVLEYAEVTPSTGSFVELSWASPTLTRQVIPSSALYSVSPRLSAAGGGDWTVSVLPALFCAAASSVTGAGLSVLTAGTAGSFTLTSRDMYGNRRTASDVPSQLVFRATFADTATSTSANARTLNSFTTGADASGLYPRTFSTTRASALTLYATQSLGAGIVATYYDAFTFMSPRVVQTDASIDFSAAAGAGFLSGLSNGEFSVRWVGYFNPGGLSCSPATFTARIDSTDERVRVWVDNYLLVDQWTQAVAATQFTGTLTLTNSVVADLRVDYYSPTATGSPSRMTVTYSNCGSGLLVRNLVGDGAFRIAIAPSVVCSGTATVAITQLLTAGAAGTFTITAFDSFSNPRATGGDEFVVRVFPTSAGACVNCPSVVRTSSTSLSDGSYTFSFLATKKGTYVAYPSFVQEGGLFATFYQGSGTSSPRQMSGGMVVDFSTAASGAAPPQSGVAANNAFSAVFVGFVRPSLASTYTFYVQCATTSLDRFALTVDTLYGAGAAALIDYSSSSPPATEVSATFAFPTANAFYDLKFVYTSSSASSARTYRLLWANTFGPNSLDWQTKQTITTRRLFHRWDIAAAAPFSESARPASATITIAPAVICGALSYATGGALTIGTAGVSASFTISSRDAFENDRDINTDDTFWTLLSGAGGSPIISATVVAAGSVNNQYIASYTATLARSYQMFSKYGATDVRYSPFALTINPLPVSGSATTLSGTAISASLFGAASTFSITAKDVYSNTLSTGGSVFVVRVVRLSATADSTETWSTGALLGAATIAGTVSDLTTGVYTATYTLPSTGFDVRRRC